MTTEETKPVATNGEAQKPAAKKVPAKKVAAKKSAAKKPAAKKSPAKKAPADRILLADLAKKAKVEPRLARRRLRDAEVNRPEGGQWSWPKSKDVGPILKVISGE